MSQISDAKARTHLVVFQPSGRRGHVPDRAWLLDAARELGVEIESICGKKRTCAKCKVRIEEGFYPREGIRSSASHVSPALREEAQLLGSELEQGYRLACCARVRGDLVVFVPEESRATRQIVRKTATERTITIKPAVRKYYVEIEPPTLHDPLGDWERMISELKRSFDLEGLVADYYVLKGLSRTLRQGEWKITVSVWMGREVIRVEPGYVERAVGLAVDVGTTTLAGYLCDLRTGEVLATQAMMNPQVPFGEDVMSRITFAMTHEDGLERLNSAIIEGLNALARDATAQVDLGPEDILEVALVGNTAMHHLLLNIDPTPLGQSPFPPTLHHSLNIKARDLGLRVCPGANVHILPIEAGFVGADNVAVLIAEEPYNQDLMTLIIDIGTNGELVLGNRHRLLSASCATGPAFEGAHIRFGMRAAPGAIERVQIDPATLEVRFKVIGQEKWNDELPSEEVRAVGICGSGIIDAVAEMFRAGILEKSGRFKKGLNHPRLRQGDAGPEYVVAWAEETTIGKDITVNIKDVRALQLAKAAMYAGAKLMMRRLGVTRLDRVILAGAFGSYIDKARAMLLGLFPDCELDKVWAVGNAAGDGARIALLNVDKREEANRVARQVEYVELTVEPDFQQEFMNAMYLPHARDRFPNLEAWLEKEGSNVHLEAIATT